MKIGSVLRSISYLVVMACIFVIGLIPALLIACLPESIRYRITPFYWLSHGAYWLLMKSWWVPVTFVGLHHIPKTPVVFAASHHSALDIPLLGYLARGRAHIWFLWYGLLKYPLFSFFVRRMGIVVDARSPIKSARSLEKSISLVHANKLSVMIFPEGGRFTDGQIHDFFRGFAILARKAACPVVPVLMKNTARVCAPCSVIINYAPITVVVGRPFVWHENESEEQFIGRVRSWFIEHIK